MSHIRAWQGLSISFLLFVVTTIFISKPVSESIDLTIFQWVHSYKHEVITTIFFIYTHIGSFLGTVIVFFVVFFIFFSKKHDTKALLLFTIVAITPFVNLLVKHLIQRKRPSIAPMIDIGGYSFPSGHTMYAVSLYGTLILLLWPICKNNSQKIILLCINSLMIIMIGLSRIYLGVHYPTDIIGGLFLSSFIISSVFYIYFLIKKKDDIPF